MGINLKTPLISKAKSKDGGGSEESNLLSGPANLVDYSSSSEIGIQRPRKTSFRFSECDGDKDLPLFQGSRGVQYFAALAANMGALALGTVISWSAVALPDLRQDVSFGGVALSEETWIGSIITVVYKTPIALFKSILGMGWKLDMPRTIHTWIVFGFLSGTDQNFVTLGAVASGPVAGYMIEAFGRQRTMWIMTIPYLAGWLLIGLAQNTIMIFIGRFITGFCSGTFTVSAPIFTAEMADVNIRGMLCAGFYMMISVGILFIYVLGSFAGWRNQALICAIFPIIIFFMMIFVPESPRYLIFKGKNDEASKALERFRGASFKEQIDPELTVLKVSIRNSEDKCSGFKGLFTMPVFRPVSIAFCLYFFQVVSGIDPVQFYTVDIFHSAGATIDDYFSTIIIGSVQVVFAAIGALLVESLGRRILLMVSEAIMVIALGFLGFYFYLKAGNNEVSPEGLNWLPLTSLIVYTIGYSVGIGPVGYLIMGEILPHHFKGLAGCFLTSAKWFMSFLMTKFFMNIINEIGNDGCYWLYAGFCVIGFVYIFFCVPETKGKTLDEIQNEFTNSYVQNKTNKGSSGCNSSTPDPRNYQIIP